MTPVAGWVVRAEPRWCARQFVERLLPGMNQLLVHLSQNRLVAQLLAKQAGHADRQVMQCLLRSEVWNVNLMRDEVRDC
ncbi:hypothetical protein OG992_33180 [Micromonospora sp. NBC_00362]|uniref:hypothetical protein n=1 Tax=Micromonospora sp. NBC_00362 TaxID=2975975 RepID=UPI00225B5818|nr:hypothetical protein [Micromonospora sp. NBC_00362]MCX5122018.1 hypothetical protein [Micromonospora sp. NBC_00362]